ncbi:MAG: BatD family protein [Myxococcota bacterium]
MARTGSALLLLLLAAPALAADVEFHMSADRTRVGTEDTFRVDIVVGNAPEGAVVQFPAPADFEVLSRSQSTQMSYSIGPGGAGVMKNVLKYTLVMRANRPGRLTIPAAGLQTATKTYKTEPIVIDVVKGRLAPDRPPPRQPSTPFGFPPGFPFPDDPFGDMPDPFDEPRVPRGEADLFLRSSLDKSEAYVGEQVMLSLYIYSRMDLMSVDTVTMPKLEGFWSQDFKSPSELRPEDAVLNGVRYRRYLLRQKALFPMKAGDFTIEAAAADITTGMYFAGSRVHKTGNPVTIKVKPLPPGGDGSTLVGRWRLTREVADTNVTLGEPVQLKLILEGKGNLQGAELPKLQVPPGIKSFDPETTDKPSTSAQLGGQRTVEYILVPQQTGTFTLPGITLRYFDLESHSWEEARVDPITLTVTPGVNGATAMGTGAPVLLTPDGPKNQLVAGGLKSLRHTAHFTGPRVPLWSQRWFLPVALGPVGLALLVAVAGLLRGALSGQSPEALKKKQARAALKRLAAARKLSRTGPAADFYAEVERALNSFLDARLGTPVTGLTRAELEARLTEHGVPEPERKRLIAVYESCDLGRYAPGMADLTSRARALDDAAAAMEAWG